MIKRIKATIDNLDDLEELTDKLKQFFGEVGKVQVDAKKAEDSLSALQRKTYYMWCSDLAKEMWGEKKPDSIHRHLKGTLLAKLYIEHDLEGYKQTNDNLKLLKRQNHPAYDHYKELAIDHMTVGREGPLTTKLMRLYMEMVEQFAAEQDCKLRHPDDLRWKKFTTRSYR